jgi:SOS-response transcriptional repressor LexA
MTNKRQNSDTLTTRQREVLAFMIDYWLKNGYAPTVREVADGLFLGSTTAFQHIKALEKKGYIETKNSPRAVKFLKGVDGDETSLIRSVRSIV